MFCGQERSPEPHIKKNLCVLELGFLKRRLPHGVARSVDQVIKRSHLSKQRLYGSLIGKVRNVAFNSRAKQSQCSADPAWLARYHDNV
jgi:hypothetical protein